MRSCQPAKKAHDEDVANMKRPLFLFIAAAFGISILTSLVIILRERMRPPDPLLSCQTFDECGRLPETTIEIYEEVKPNEFPPQVHVWDFEQKRFLKEGIRTGHEYTFIWGDRSTLNISEMKRKIKAGKMKLTHVKPNAFIPSTFAGVQRKRPHGEGILGSQNYEFVELAFYNGKLFHKTVRFGPF